eukprot:709886-Amphidinium_carterae.1
MHHAAVRSAGHDGQRHGQMCVAGLCYKSAYHTEYRSQLCLVVPRTGASLAWVLAKLFYTFKRRGTECREVWLSKSEHRGHAFEGAGSLGSLSVEVMEVMMRVLRATRHLRVHLQKA